MKDSFGRNINYMRISLTDRCNLRCIYCMPPEGIPKMSHVDILRNEEIVRITRVAADLGISHIRLTGGEPLVRKGVIGLIDDIHAIEGIENISLTTNAILLLQMAKDLKEAGLDRVNISLDTLDPVQFTEITRLGKLECVLNGIDAALEVGFDPVKINAVTVRRLNQDFLSFALMSVDRPLHMRFIEYMPVGASSGYDNSGWGPEDVISSEEVRDAINASARAKGLPELEEARDDEKPLGYGPAKYYRFPNALGTVGFISPLSKHFCNECNRLRLTADGKLRPCLFSDVEYDLHEAVRSGSDADIAGVFYTAIGAKPDEHHDKVGTERGMSAIGG
ncbi:MAG: GTP 3',8-cyclase MoaA [Eggerthellaceae bacterium]|nr:GTP 3',8-cyclase MoaA [Eggerthellaceae bacterium]